MAHGIIVKALSGFYYVRCGDETFECRSRGRLRRVKPEPLVGDRVEITAAPGGKGQIESIDERRNSFVRPSVANIDMLVIIASADIPVTDPYLIDRISAIAELSNCDVAICINKSDLNSGDELFDIYSSVGYPLIRTSTITGEGIDELKAVMKGTTCAFTGNSGVGKSSILNALEQCFNIKVGEVSRKLGRGKHTTTHVELYSLGDDTYIADTPGFASFDAEEMAPVRKDELQNYFPEFRPFIGNCRFSDCSHKIEPGCAVIEAVNQGKIHPSRHASYKRLYEAASKIKEWEYK